MILISLFFPRASPVPPLQSERHQLLGEECERVQITEQILKNIFKGNVSELAIDKGLSYTLLYNLIHGRIRSLSSRDYKIIFGEEPLYQELKSVDGGYFRGMVRLWLFLNNEITEATLYREFYPDKNFRRVDYRIFTGKVKAISTRLEKIMESRGDIYWLQSTSL